MPRYHATWEIDIEDTDNPVEAAREAFAIMQKTDTTANVFTIHDENGNAFKVDLESIDNGDDCRTCGASYEDGGDGYDGECPDCADITAAAEEPDDADDDGHEYPPEDPNLNALKGFIRY